MYTALDMLYRFMMTGFGIIVQIGISSDFIRVPAVMSQIGP